MNISTKALCKFDTSISTTVYVCGKCPFRVSKNIKHSVEQHTLS